MARVESSARTRIRKHPKAATGRAHQSPEPSASIHVRSVYAEKDEVAWHALFRVLEPGDATNQTTSGPEPAARADAVAPAARGTGPESMELEQYANKKADS